MCWHFQLFLGCKKFIFLGGKIKGGADIKWNGPLDIVMGWGLGGTNARKSMTSFKNSVNSRSVGWLRPETFHRKTEKH